jgi:Domain of unknown function (DUF4260)
MVTSQQFIRSHIRLTMPGALLRLEGFAVLTVVMMLYAHQGYSWLMFVLLLFVPDLAILTFSLNKRLGSIVYNLIHSYTLPLFLAVISFVSSYAFGLQWAFIWLAHIAIDRIIGYGLKYLGQFKETHLSHI